MYRNKFNVCMLKTTTEEQPRPEPQASPSRAHPSTSVKQESYNLQEGNSTSSNEDDPQQPMMTLMTKQRPMKLSTHSKTVPKLRVPPVITVSIQDSREMRKKKLHKRKRKEKYEHKLVLTKC